MTLANLSPAARELVEQRAKLAGISDNRIPRYPNTGSSPLSFVQEGVWLTTQLFKTTAVFNRCSAIRTRGILNTSALQRALTEIVRRHETLRTRVNNESGVPRMAVLPAEVIPLPVTDFSDVAADTRATRLVEILNAEVRKSFDLDVGPWFRAGILRASEMENTLFITTHHIATDGWSDSVMFRELDLLYAAFARDEPSPLADPMRQFRDFAQWQRQRSTEAEGFRDVEYWRERLADAPKSQELPTDHPRPEIARMEGAQVSRVIPSELAQSLAEIGRAERATPAMTALAAFTLLQSRITDQTDTIVGLSVTGRTRPELEDLIGLFSEVVPIPVQVDREMTFRELVRSVRATVLEAHEHQHVPVSAILESLPSAQGVLHPEIARTLFNFRNMPAFEPALEGLNVEPIEVFNGSSVADLDLEIVERRDGWKCHLRFRTALFEEATARRLLGHFTTLLESIARNPDEEIGRIEILAPREREQVLRDFMGQLRDLPEILRIEDLIRVQAEKTPRAIAVATEGRVVSYDDLDRFSNALATNLQSRGAKPGDLIGVCISRSVEMVVAVLAVLKCGAAFVPLDPEYPPGRLAHMLSDTEPALLLTDKRGTSILGSGGIETLLIDSEFLSRLEPRRPAPLVNPDPNAVACVLYTSGSTGLPKGVLSTHRGIANNLLAVQGMYALQPGDCMLQHTSLGFDAAAWEIFWPLMVGARIYLARAGGQRDADYLVGIIRDQRVATVGAAPSMLRVMLEMPGFTECTHVRRVMVYGEVLSPTVREKFYSRMPQAELDNLYGPTETSVTVTAWTCQRGSKRRSVPIGRPMPNCEIYILDKNREPVPIGVPGEIYIGGTCVSAGYHNRPELNAERFPPHPFRPHSGDRVYKTGDIARFDADGVIEYIGRRDHQLKIRGVRVELEEIEAALERLPEVRESVVIAQPVGAEEYKLIGYVAVTDPKTLPNDLRSALQHDLPPQFIPALIVRLAKLPHGPNGKVDRAALPDASQFVNERPAEKHLPGTQDEIRVAAIWKELLDLLDVGTRESFFSLGGHSLLAVRMVQRVNDELGSQISLRSFYEEPTIAGVTARLSRKETAAAEMRSSLFRVRDKTDRATLFYFNGQPAGGGRYAHRFTPYLPDNRGFCLVPLPILSAPTTVEEIAAQMIGVMRNEQSRGPYVLGGNCFGATLSLEIAQQLTNAGEKVPLVALVHPDALATTHPWFRVMRRFALMTGVPEEFHTAEFGSAFGHTTRTLSAVWKAQRKMSWGERLDRFMNAGRWTRQFVYGQRVPLRDEENDCMSRESELVTHRRHMEDAWIAYTLRPYTGKVAIVWPLEGPSNPPWNPRSLWKHFTPKFEWKEVPGNHWSMLHEHFEHSARALGEFISRADA